MQHDELFWQKVNKEPGQGRDGDCWEYKGARNSSGRGVIKRNKKTIFSHRYSYFLTNNTYPPLLRHTCDNPVCVNPSHLIPGTQSQNCMDMVERKRHNKARISHCPQGHEYTDENTFYSTTGGRKCMQCNKPRAYRLMMDAKANE